MTPATGSSRTSAAKNPRSQPGHYWARQPPFVAPGQPQTFDAETAPEQIGSVFDEVVVHAWDTAAYVLPDEGALRQYLRGWACQVTGDLAAVEYPFTITKRGAVVYGKKH